MALGGLISAGLGLAGMLVKPKTPKYIKQAEALNEEQARRSKELYGMAKAYDPNASIDLASKYATDKGAYMLERADKNIKGAAMTGNVPLGGYQSLRGMQRATDDILNPIQEQIMQLKANAPLQKLQVMGQYAGGNVQPGQIAQNILQTGQAAPQQDIGGSMQLLSQGIDQMTPQSSSRLASNGNQSGFVTTPHPGPNVGRGLSVKPIRYNALAKVGG